MAIQLQFAVLYLEDKDLFILVLLKYVTDLITKNCRCAAMLVYNAGYMCTT